MVAWSCSSVSSARESHRRSEFGGEDSSEPKVVHRQGLVIENRLVSKAHWRKTMAARSPRV